jgi:hypothetical protein
MPAIATAITRIPSCSAFQPSLGASRPPDSGAPIRTAKDIDEFVTGLRGYLASLPADRFPLTVALATALTQGAGDERFEFGIQVIVAGLASFVSAAD